MTAAQQLVAEIPCAAGEVRDRRAPRRSQRGARATPPAHVEPQRDDAVDEVVARRDAVEHRLDDIGLHLRGGQRGAVHRDHAARTTSTRSPPSAMRASATPRSTWRKWRATSSVTAASASSKTATRRSAASLSETPDERTKARTCSSKSLTARSAVAL